MALALRSVLRARGGRGTLRFSRCLQPYGSGGSRALLLVSYAHVRISRMADRAHHCKYCLLTAHAVCVSKRPLAASTGVHLRRRPHIEWHGPHPRNDLRAHCFFGPFFTPCPGLLFIAAAPRSIDLSSLSITDSAKKRPTQRSVIS